MKKLSEKEIDEIVNNPELIHDHYQLVMNHACGKTYLSRENLDVIANNPKSIYAHQFWEITKALNIR